MKRAQTGLALILIAGLLMLLAVVGSAFLRFSLGLREAGGLALDRIDARLLARSGVQYAASRLFQTSDVPKPPSAENQSDDWTYRDGAGFPLEQSRNPSYAQTEPYVDVDGNGRYDAGVDTVSSDLNGNRAFDSWSGRLRSRHGIPGETFALNVLGESGKINVNGGWLDGGNRNADKGNQVPDYRDVEELRNRRYVLLLDNLGQIVNVSTTSRDPNALQNGAASLLGDLVKGRPLGGYLSMDQIRGRLSVPDWEKVRDFLTVTETERAKFSVQAPGATMYVNHLVSEARPLVNVSAASSEVLQALALGLIDYAPPPFSPWSNCVDPALALKTADHLIANRPFASWCALYKGLYHANPSIHPQSAYAPGTSARSSSATPWSWASVVFGNLIADEAGGYSLWQLSVLSGLSQVLSHDA